MFIYLFPCLYIYIIYLDISEGQLLCFRCSYIQVKGWNYGNKSIRRDIPLWLYYLLGHMRIFALLGHTRIFALGLFVDFGISPCPNFATFTALCVLSEMKAAFCCGFSTLMCHLHWYLQDCLLFIMRGSCSLKSSFSLARSACPKLHDFSQLFGQVGMVAQKCFATRSPKHTISFSLMPPPGLSLTCREAADAF